MNQDQWVKEHKHIGKIEVGFEMQNLLVIVRNEEDYLFKPEIPIDECGYETGITLDEKLEQVKKEYQKIGTITVIVELGLHGEIYKYGNHGDCWEIHGQTKGYA